MSNPISHLAPLMSISRHRILTDGDGICSLVTFYGCPLHCQYCINKECHNESSISRWISPKELFDELMKDDIYFRATGGGVTFGGGEPLLYSDFIREFADICKGRWIINIETSLNVSRINIQKVQKIVKHFYIDIKDMSPNIYHSYTGNNNDIVYKNLSFLIKNGYLDKMTVRVPHIQRFNTAEDIKSSIELLSSWGISHIDIFDYSLNKREAYNKTSSNRGKVVCMVLKQVRKLVAEANSIPFEASQCNFLGKCIGTCPRCEQELHYLSTKIWEMENNTNINI